MKNKKNKVQKNPQNKKQQNIFSKKNQYWIFGLLFITLIAYFPVFQNNFVYDDHLYITENPIIKQLSLQNIKIYFSQHFEGLYQPLTLFSLAIDYYFSELNPSLYHFTNLLLHLINTALVFWLIYLLINNLEISIITAALFGVHTFHVESVAWATERKDVLFALFFLFSLICYVKYITQYNYKYFFYSLLLFLLSILSKGQAVSLSVSLIAIDFLLGRKLLDKKVIFEKLPFFALSIIFGIVALKGAGTLNDATIFPFYERVLFASYGFTEYLLKLIFPLNLSVFYPYPDKIGGSIPFSYWLYPIPVIAIIALFFYSLKRNKLLAFGIAFFAINIFLVLQLIPNAPTIISDRYSYIPSVGFFFLIGVGYKKILENRYQLKNTVQFIFILYVLLLTIGTFNRSKIWKDDLTLFDDVLSKYPKVWLAYNNRGIAKSDAGDFSGAIQDYNNAINLHPKHVNAYTNRGKAKMELGDLQGAINDYNKAVQLEPNDAGIYLNRGVVKDKLNDLSGAIDDYSKAIQLKPQYPEAYYNRGSDKAMLRDLNGALTDFNKSIELNPEFAKAYLNRGMINIELGQKDAGCMDLRKASKFGSEMAYNLIKKYCSN